MKRIYFEAKEREKFKGKLRTTFRIPISDVRKQEKLVEVRNDAFRFAKDRKGTADQHLCCIHWERPPFVVKDDLYVSSDLTLTVCDVKTERLQDISDDGIRKEGVVSMCAPDSNGKLSVEEYKQFWDSQDNMPAWSENPMVWVFTVQIGSRL